MMREQKGVFRVASMLAGAVIVMLVALPLGAKGASGVPRNAASPSITCLGEQICAGLPPDRPIRSRDLANEVLEAVVSMPEQEQQFLLDKRRNARGFAIFPNVQKGGILGASIRGRGILSVREDDGTWTAPIVLTIEGHSVGPQVGMQSSNVLFIFHTICSIKDFLSGHHHMSFSGSECTVLHVDHPDPALAEPTDISIHVFERGAVLGQSIDRYAIHIDEEANATLYGMEVKPGCMVEAVRSGIALPWMLRIMQRLNQPADEAHATFTVRDVPSLANDGEGASSRPDGAERAPGASRPDQPARPGYGR